MFNDNNEKQSNNGKMFALAKKGVSVAGKVVSFSAKSVIKVVGIPTVIIIIIAVLCVAMAEQALFGERGSAQEYNIDANEGNKTQKIENSRGNMQDVVTEMGEEHEFAEKYYKFYSIQSYYKVAPGENTLLSFKDNTDVFCGLLDYYGKEDSFYMSNSLIMSLDEVCHEYSFIYPEQFIKPVYMDGGLASKKLGQITDDFGNIIAESTKYSDKGKATPETTKGLWDYGFGSILYYANDEKRKFVIGNYYAMDVYDAESDSIKQISLNQDYRLEIPDSLEYISLITNSVSTSGDIEYVYEKTDVYNSAFRAGSSGRETDPVTKYQYGSVMIGEESYPLYKYRKGAVYDYLPVETNQISDLHGREYLDSYLSWYKTYVPNNIIDDLDYRNRIEDSAALFEKLDVLDIFNSNSEKALALSSALPPGSQIGTSKYENAVSYLPLCKKYGNMFGIDPNLLVAMIAQESGGVVDTPNGGLMQISSGKNDMHIVDTNGTTQNIIWSELDLYNAEDNIFAGAAYLRACINAFQTNSNIPENLPLAVQAYNFGVSGLSNCVLAYSKATGKTLENIYSNPGDLGWANYRDKFTGGGDKQYLEHVNSYYNDGNLLVSSAAGTTDSFSATEAVNVYAASSAKESFLSKALKKASSFFSDIFSGLGELFDTTEPNTFIAFENNINPFDIDNILANTMAFDNLSNYYDAYDTVIAEKNGEGVSESVFISLSGNSASNYIPFDLIVASELQGCVNPTTYIPAKTSNVGMRIHPVKKYPQMHYGEDYSVPSGTPLYSVSNGLITVAKAAGERGKTVVIQFGEYSVRYQHMNSICVEIGDTVKKGQLVGTSGSTGIGTGPHLHVELMKGNNLYSFSDYFYKK